MKRGLVSPSQLAFTTVNSQQQGAALGPFIVEVVDAVDEFDVSSPFYWVDCPNETVAYLWYYNVGTSTAIGGDPLTYYATLPSRATLTTTLGQDVYVWPPASTPPANTTLLAPPTADSGQNLYWYSSAWVVSSFDPSLALPQAKSSLISDVTQNGAISVNTQLSLYSAVQQIDAANVLTLNTLDYPGSTIGDYQTYVDGLVASSTATINAAGSTTALYSFNPADVPFTPTLSGVMNTSRTGLDFNPSTYTTFTSTTLTPAETELFIPATSTVLTYGQFIPGQFDSAGDCFTTGNYTVLIRQVSTGFVLAEFTPPAGANVDVPF